MFSADPGVGASSVSSQQQPVSQANLDKSPIEPVKIDPAQQEIKTDQAAGTAPVSLLNKSSNLDAPDQATMPDAQSTVQPANEATTQVSTSTYSQALESAGQTASSPSDANFSLTSPAVAATPPAGSLISEDLGALSLREAAVSGNANAQFVVASRYLDGKVIDQDFAKAAEWYNKSASQGLAPAQYRYGTLFERGRGVSKNIDTARLWYERAAERQNVKAMHNLAVIYSNNDGNKAEFSKAAKWFRAAADHGLKDSLYNLAVLYERGLGVSQDTNQAYFWYGCCGTPR